MHGHQNVKFEVYLVISHRDNFSFNIFKINYTNTTFFCHLFSVEATASYIILLYMKLSSVL